MVQLRVYSPHHLFHEVKQNQLYLMSRSGTIELSLWAAGVLGLDFLLGFKRTQPSGSVDGLAELSLWAVGSLGQISCTGFGERSSMALLLKAWKNQVWNSRSWSPTRAPESLVLWCCFWACWIVLSVNCGAVEAEGSACTGALISLEFHGEGSR
jgi:hypothetical protein